MAAESGEIPKALKNKPSLHSIELEAWNGFARLSSRRPVSGFGAVGGIPYVEMLSYIDGVLQVEDEDDRLLLIELIEYLDADFLREVAAKHEADRQKTAKPSPKPPTAR